MIKRTPQEFADIFQGYVFRNCGSASWIVTPDKPKIAIGEWQWDHDSTLWFLVPVSAIKTDPDHDWTHLYEPHPYNKSDANYQNQPEVDNKAPHQSEVFAHREYNVIKDETLPGLAAKVAHRMENGWKLQGGVTVEHLPISDGYAEDGSVFYQAMVRGV